VTHEWALGRYRVSTDPRRLDEGVVSPLPVPARLGRVVLRPTTEADLPFVLEMERATSFVRHWNDAEHRAVLADPHCAHWMVETQSRRAGYVILRGLGGSDGAIELKRINIAEPGRGLGRETLRLLKRIVFEDLRAHRLWLDVMAHNAAAGHLYRSEGFVPEGVMREALSVEGRYVDLVLMAILEDEYRAATA
jgi:RimJ/RimL family protein N-acetyltransferase